MTFGGSAVWTEPLDQRSGALELLPWWLPCSRCPSDLLATTAEDTLAPRARLSLRRGERDAHQGCGVCQRSV